MHALNPSLLVLSITGFGHDGEIARSLHDLIGLASPTLSVLLGQGTGGGALALFPADRTIAAQHGWLSPLPPPREQAPSCTAAPHYRSLGMNQSP